MRVKTGRSWSDPIPTARGWADVAWNEGGFQTLVTGEKHTSGWPQMDREERAVNIERQEEVALSGSQGVE
jgi:hypothetical protein